MSFDAGFAAGLEVGKKKFSGASTVISEGWQIPDYWQIFKPQPNEVTAMIEIPSGTANSVSVRFYDLYSDRNSTAQKPFSKTIDWGDGNIDAIPSSLSQSVSHTYSSAGIFYIKITMDFTLPYVLATVSAVSRGVKQNYIIFGEKVACGGADENNVKYLRFMGTHRSASTRMFVSHKSLKRVDFDVPITSLPDNGLNGCISLESIDLSYVTSIGDNSIVDCFQLKKLNMPSLSTVRIDNFINMYNLIEFDAPSLTELKNYNSYGVNANYYNSYFVNCFNLKRINTPSLINLSGEAFLRVYPYDTLKNKYYRDAGVNHSTYLLEEFNYAADCDFNGLSLAMFPFLKI